MSRTITKGDRIVNVAGQELTPRYSFVLFLPVDIWQFISHSSMPRLVMLWKQYEFRPHFSAIRLMCNYFFKRGILLYLILVFIYYFSTTGDISNIRNVRVCIVLDEIYFRGIAVIRMRISRDEIVVSLVEFLYYLIIFHIEYGIN